MAPAFSFRFRMPSSAKSWTSRCPPPAPTRRNRVHPATTWQPDQRRRGQGRGRRGLRGTRLAAGAGRRGVSRCVGARGRCRRSSNSSSPNPESPATSWNVTSTSRASGSNTKPARYFASFSARVVVYKGMLTPDQLRTFYPDLVDPRLESALALVHSRFSTNTFPSWPLAHPTGCSRTTARSTPCKATRTGCARVKA